MRGGRVMSNSWCAIALGSLVGASILISGIDESARAASVQRLADGRVVVSIYGQRLSFREKDAEQIKLHLPQCDNAGGYLTNLAEWLNDPIVTCLKRDDIPDSSEGDGVPSFTVSPVLDGGRGFPGDIDPTKLFNTALGPHARMVH